MRSTAFPSLLHAWLRQLIRTIPSDDASDLLSFGTASGDADHLPYLRSAQLILVVVNHCLCTPFPFDFQNSMNALLCISDGVMEKESVFDVSVELCIFLARVQGKEQPEWRDFAALLRREMISSLAFCNVVNRRVQLERTLRLIQLNERVKGSMLLSAEESVFLEEKWYDWLVVATNGMKSDKKERLVAALLASLSAEPDAVKTHFVLTTVGVRRVRHLLGGELRGGPDDPAAGVLLPPLLRRLVLAAAQRGGAGAAATLPARALRAAPPPPDSHRNRQCNRGSRDVASGGGRSH